MSPRFSKVATAFICCSLIACGGGGSDSNSSVQGGSDNSAQGALPNSNVSIPLRLALESYIKSDFTATFTAAGTVYASGKAIPVAGNGRLTKGAAMLANIPVTGTYAGRQTLQAVEVMSGNLSAQGQVIPGAGTGTAYYDPTTFFMMVQVSGNTQFEFTPYTVPDSVKAGAAGTFGTGSEIGCSLSCSQMTASYAIEPDSPNTLLVRLVQIIQRPNETDTAQTVYRVDSAGNTAVVSLTVTTASNGQTMGNVTFTFDDNRVTALPSTGAPPSSPATGSAPGSTTGNSSSTGATTPPSTSTGGATSGSTTGGTMTGSTPPTSSTGSNTGGNNGGSAGDSTGGSTGGVTSNDGTSTPSSGTASLPPFQATLASAPADGQYICGLTNLVVQGSGIKNAELLPPNGYTPKYGVFTISPDGTQAQMTLDPRGFPNGELQVRISAYDVFNGQMGQEIVVMSARRWLIANDTWPCQSPGSLSAGH